MPTDAAYFDRLYAASEDPYGFRTRWYERRKFALTAAALSRERYRSGLDVGCSNGELSARLADRCERFLACDGSARAVALARARLRDRPHAQVLHWTLPAQWPAGEFDLIVISELGYFLEPSPLDALLGAARASLAEDGEVVLVHWTGANADAPLDGARVHAPASELFGPWLRPRLRCADADFLLDVWSSDPRWVAQREGIRP
jgi:SAM-dependent methyltransferase